MKYIRTKDGIWEIEKLAKYDNCVYTPYHNNFDISECKKADTIEELCDEFVVVAEYRFKFPKTASEVNRDFDEMRDFYTDKDDIIYGAIWTDNGLIYVAKMNDKGELELI